MKEILKRPYKSSLAAFLMLVMFLTACELDDVDPDGDVRDKFIGTWQFDESDAKSDLAFYTVQISKNPGNTSQVLISNFADVSPFYSVFGIVTPNRIEVPEQKMLSVEVNGIGTLRSSSLMNWTYSVSTGADLTHFTAKANKMD